MVDLYEWTPGGMVKTKAAEGIEYVERSEFDALVRVLSEVDAHLDHFTPTVPKPSALYAALRATSDGGEKPLCPDCHLEYCDCAAAEEFSAVKCRCTDPAARCPIHA